MKKLNLLSAFYIFFAIFSLNSCSDIEPLGYTVGGETPTGPGTGPVTNGNFKVDFDDQTFIGFANTAFIGPLGVAVTSVNADGNAFVLNIPGVSVGTYPVNPAPSSYMPLGGLPFFSVDPANSDLSTGTYTISELDTVAKTVSGTFQFKGFQTDMQTDVVLATKQFTNGIFTAIPYTGEIPEGGEIGVVFENFFAKVNGENFLAVDDFLFYGPTSINNVLFDSFKATNADGDEITVNIKSNTPVGTYNITAAGTTDKVQIKYKKGVNVNKATSGTVKITVRTPAKITGTFSGVVIIGGVTYTITEGQFKADL